jgi:hypothetical protein
VGFGDNFEFAGSAVTFPVANAVLGGIPYKVAETQTLLIAALRFDVSVSFPEMTETPFSYGVPLPVAIFLNPPVGADSVVTLIETIGTMMWHDWDGRLPAFLSAYNAAVAELEEMDEEDEGAASATAPTSRITKASGSASATPPVWMPTLMDRMDTFFIMLEKCICKLWSQKYADDDTRLLPWPKTAAALGEFTSIDHAEDLLMSFGLAPPAHKSSWRPFQVLAILEYTLASSGFPDVAPGELEPMSHRARLRFFGKCMRNGSPRKRRNVTIPQGAAGVPPRSDPGGGASRGGFNGDLSFRNAFDGAENHAAGGATGGAPTGVDIGVPTNDPDQIRRNQAEMMGRNSQVGVPGRSEAIAQMAQAFQGNFNPMEQMKQVHGHLTSELLQQRLAVGLEPDGPGNYHISRAPVDVCKAIITNSGDSKRKLGLQDTIQTGMSSDGYSVTFVRVQVYCDVPVPQNPSACVQCLWSRARRGRL